MRKNIAAKIVSDLHKSGEIGNNSLQTLKSNENIDSITEYTQLLGKFMGKCYFNVFLPIWKAYPELRPREMEEESTPAPRLSDETKKALRDFIEHGRQALKLIDSTFPPGQPDSLLKHDEILEIQQVLTAIEEFVERQ